MNVVPILRYCATSARVKSLSLASDGVNVCVFSYFIFPIHKITPCQNSNDEFAEISSYELVCYLYVSCMFWLDLFAEFHVDIGHKTTLKSSISHKFRYSNFGRNISGTIGTLLDS